MFQLNLRPYIESGEEALRQMSTMKRLPPSLKRSNELINQSKESIPLVKPAKEFTNDDPSKIGTGAVKYDGGKAALFRGVVQYFPRAVNAVGEISTFGASKYAWAGWEGVEDGINRYSDAMVRHLLKK